MKPKRYLWLAISLIVMALIAYRISADLDRPVPPSFPDGDTGHACAFCTAR